MNKNSDLMSQNITEGEKKHPKVFRYASFDKARGLVDELRKWQKMRMGLPSSQGLQAKFLLVKKYTDEQFDEPSLDIKGILDDGEWVEIPSGKALDLIKEKEEEIRGMLEFLGMYLG